MIADAGGKVLASAAELLAEVRSTDKPLHPHGRLRTGRLERLGNPEPVGVPWLDRTGTDEVLARTSRAIGLPSPLPDIHGLAVRVPVDDEYADLLFATTAWNRVGRHVLVPTMGAGPSLTTLLPYRTAAGPVVIGARQSGSSYDLSWATVGGGWHRFAELRLSEPAAPDAVVSFDPVLNRPPGLTPYAWVTALRERAYATARAHRRVRDGRPGDRAS